jgi:hypothetical protein
MHTYIQGRDRQKNGQTKEGGGREHHQIKTANGFENADFKRVWKRPRQTSKF